MGALTDSRKRASADHRLIPSFPSSAPSPSKKPKLAPFLPPHLLSPASPLVFSHPLVVLLGRAGAHFLNRLHLHLLIFLVAPYPPPPPPSPATVAPAPHPCPPARHPVPLYKHLHEESSRQRDPRLRILEFEERLAQKGRLGLEPLDRPQTTPGKKEVPEPFVPLKDEDEDRVHHALGGKNRHEILSVHEASNIVITREILQCLNDKNWLNDEVINLYLELLKQRELREPSKFIKCHFFNTFFYKKLINTGYDYNAVRRWTTKRKLGYNLIDCDKIFVPIHKEVHWCLAVINIRDKKFQYLDSLGSMDMKALKILARYLVDEVKDKSGKQIDVLSWKHEGVQNLPLQENGWDCGMFMIKYIDFYSRDMDLTFGQKHMPYFRRRTAKEILDSRAG